MQYRNFIGIDLSKEMIDVALLTEEGEIFDFKWNNDKSVMKKEFKKLFKEKNLTRESVLLCAEYTGQYGNKLVDCALSLDLNLWMESAFTIVRSQGLVRGKSDKIDAVRIAEYARRFSDKVTLVRPTPKSIVQMKHLSSERNLLLQDLSKYKAQLKQEEGFLEAEYFKTKLKRIRKVIKTLEEMVNQVDKALELIVSTDPSIKKNYDTIVSIDGVGKQTAIATIVATNNFLKFNDPRKFACHIGCAPFRYQSGTSLNSRNKVSQRANKNLKKIFHMAALSTIRMEGELKIYYLRKVEEGKHKMSILNAIRSKLIHRIFSLVKQDKKYEKNYIHSLA